MTVRAAVGALAGAAVLALALGYVIGFPENVPVALALAVFLAELIERGVQAQRPTTAFLGRALFHAVLAGLAGWLGVQVVALFGGVG